MIEITWTMEAYLSGSWVDISADVIKEDLIRAKWGFPGNSFEDRFASTGTMSFSLRNNSNKYSPDHASALAGWKNGVPVLLTMTGDGVTKKFRGKIDYFTIDAGVYGRRRVNVKVSDWMRETTDYPLTLATLETNKYANQGLTTIVNRLPTSPQDTSFEDGDNLFPTLFDAVSTKTRAYSEINKILMSELGYCYLRKDPVYGETLVFENSSHRNGMQGLSTIPTPSSLTGFLLMEDSDHLLQETGDKIILEESQTPSFDNTMSRAEVDYGNNIINYANVSAYPKAIDSSPQVLYSLSYPQAVAAGQTITIKGNYSDPSGGNAVNVQSTTMITPLINTDYKLWTNSDGTGTDLTSDAAITATYGTESVLYEITNGNTKSGYVTLLQARGYGIYSYDRLMFDESSSDSYDTYGYSQSNLDQIYKQDMYEGVLEARTLVEMEKDPRSDLKRVTFWGTDETNMLAFLSLDVGDIISIQEDQSGVDGYFYIQAVEFELHPKGQVMFTWILRQFFCLAAGLSLLAVEFAPSPATNYINYGYIPKIAESQTTRSISAWIYADSLALPGGYSIIGNDSVTYYPGFAVYLSTHSDGAGGEQNRVDYFQRTSSSDPIYFKESTTDGIPLSTWVNIVLTMDASTITNTPKVYYDGVEKTMAAYNVASGTLKSEVGSPLVIGGIELSGYEFPFDGKLADLRIYNRILTAAEAAQIYSEGIGGTGVTDGLIFQGPAVKTKKLADYVDQALTSTMKLLDVYKHRVGTAIDSPTGRAIP